MLNSTSSVRRFAAIAALMALAACGGGGTAASSPSPDDPGSPVPPPAPPSAGLTVTGPGGATVGGAFKPESPGGVSISGPDCASNGTTTVCSSHYAVGWTEIPSEGMVVDFSSTGVPPPGTAPGVGINSINLVYSVFLNNGFGLVCGPINGTTCDFQALGVTLDTAARTVTFVNTPLGSPVAGGDGVILNGTLGY